MAGVSTEVWLWGGFSLFIVAMLALDLGIMHRRPHVIGMKEALTWFAVWTGLALLFNIGIVLFYERGSEAGLEFLTGYLVEKSLSIDNVFVFILVFSYFHVPPAYQHKVLFWGIIGAIVMRVIFIVGGLALMERFHWTIYVFGTFLVVTGIAMMRRREEAYDAEKNWLIRHFRRVVPVTTSFQGDRFFVRRDGRWWATPLFLTLLAVESSDIIFAVDSIPAIFAITQDPFIVYTSNIFAMLGLRALYFAVAGIMQMFHALHYGFASIIVILGIKMLLSDVYKVPVVVSLALIVLILLACVIYSLLRPRRAELKMLFKRTESLGLIPFRRLLLIENIIDVGTMKVKETMRRRDDLCSLDLELPWKENLETMRRKRFSRYPLVEGNSPSPLGIVHIKDLVLSEDIQELTSPQLRELARPCMKTREETLIEDLLALFQRRFEQIAAVHDENDQWTGIITIEDVLEEIVGKISDEFDTVRAGPFVSLADALSPGRIVLDFQSRTVSEAVRAIVDNVPPEEWPLPSEKIVESVSRREAMTAECFGYGVAVSHARFPQLEKPILVFARSGEGVAVKGSQNRVELFFILLTPTAMGRLQPLLLADIVGLFESEYVLEKLRKSDDPAELIETIRAGQQVVLD